MSAHQKELRIREGLERKHWGDFATRPSSSLLQKLWDHVLGDVSTWATCEKDWDTGIKSAYKEMVDFMMWQGTPQ